MAYLVQTIATKFIFLILIFSLTKAAISLPFVVFLGIGETCQSMEEFIQILEKDSGNHGHCIMLGDNVEDSVLVPIMDQVTLACQKVKELDELKNGYNLIGISQGGLISRGMIEFCDEGPQVKNFISVGGPQAGVAGAPNCSFPICARLTNLLNLLPVYSTFIQASVAPSNYIKIPTTQLYKEDLIGLKALHEAGKVTFKKAPGEHVNLSDALYEMISPFLKDESSTQKIAVA
ncbi:uncharacterized protein LOC141592277 isoform X3 [Silene latifolia]|uniref:uncharacterized protein LOC141592277 isoform X3 n=1 Tax=Silene latifolia TaxID=37657 RepID=UPI003D77F956